MELKFIQVRYRNEVSLMRLSELAIPLIEQYYKPIVPKKNLQGIIYFFCEKALAKEIKEKRYDYYFISFEDRYIGFIEMHKKDDSLWVSQLHLKPEKRNKGFGKKIIDLLKEIAKKQNLKKLRIGIPNDKEDVNKIFIKLGFYPTKEIARYVGDSHFVYEHIYYYNLQ